MQKETFGQLNNLPVHKLKRYLFEGRRYYDTPLGLAPSVTTILSATKPEKDRKGLARWREEVGEEEANKILRDAISRGNEVHQAVETTLGAAPEPEEDQSNNIAGAIGQYLTGKVPKLSDEAWPFYNSLLYHLDSIGEVYLIEAPIWHPLGYAGTVDLVARLNGSLVDFEGDTIRINSPWVVIDWKTARKPKKWQYVDGHRLQLAAYAAGLNRVYPETFRICHGLIFVALADRPAQIFYSPPPQMSMDWKNFQTRLDEYKKLVSAESQIPI